ncbi:hypothetical protein BDK51DRAFT_30446, partial [Blyttiomyces helicus]
SFKDFHLLAAEDNKMKSIHDFGKLMTTAQSLLKTYGDRSSICLVGNFYVFINSVKVLHCRLPQWSLLAESRLNWLLWLDPMHVELNLQETLLKVAWPILVHQLWAASYTLLDPIKIRPIRCIEVLKPHQCIVAACAGGSRRWYKRPLAAMDNYTGMARDVLRWLLDEAVPLSLATNAVAIIKWRWVMNGRLTLAKFLSAMQTLARALPTFTRLRKKNYVIVVAYMLGFISYLESHGGQGLDSFLRHLPQLSSEDLEVWHSKCRQIERNHDTPSQLSLYHSDETIYQIQRLASTLSPKRPETVLRIPEQLLPPSLWRSTHIRLQTNAPLSSQEMSVGQMDWFLGQVTSGEAGTLDFEKFQEREDVPGPAEVTEDQ